jgi:hypothetical protein
MEPKGTVMQMPQWVLDLEDTITGEERKLDNSPPEEGDEELGEVPEDLRLLYCTRNVILREARARVKAHRKVCWDQDCNCEEFFEEIELLKDQSDLLDWFFWFSLQMHFCIRVGSIAVRNGWKVVKCLDSKTDEPDEMNMTLADLVSKGVVTIGLDDFNPTDCRAN